MKILSRLSRLPCSREIWRHRRARRSRPSKGLAALEAAARESALRGERVRVSASRVYGVWAGGRAGARALARLAEAVCLVDGYEDSAQWAPGDAYDAWGATAEDGEWRLTIDW